MNIENKSALITGGTKGIGLGIAEAMLKNGMNVAITGRTQASCDEVATQLSKKYNRKVLGYEADVRSYDRQQEIVQSIQKNWGELDVVIANAGVGHFAPIDQLTSEQWNETIDVNLTGVFNTTKASLESLIQSKGYLITIASLAGTNFFPNGAAYNASKFGLVGYSQAVMLDVRDKGVKVSTIMPGSVATHFNNHQPNDADAWKIQPEDIGQLVIDLLRMDARSLPSKIEVRPSQPPKK